MATDLQSFNRDCGLVTRAKAVAQFVYAVHSRSLKCDVVFTHLNSVCYSCNPLESEVLSMRYRGSDFTLYSTTSSNAKDR